MNKKYKAIYFHSINKNKKKIPKNVIVAFNDAEMDLYNKIKSLTSKEIRKIIGMFSYNDLLATAKKENRKVTRIIKMRLSEKLLYDNKRINRSVVVNPFTVKKWIKVLKKDSKNNRIYSEISSFFENIVNSH